jgi:tellurite resistance protein TerC
MRRRGDVRAIRLDRSWEENLQMIRATRFSRYPVLEHDGTKPIGIIHVKDLFVAAEKQIMAGTLKQLARPGHEIREDLPLEEALARFQGRYDQMAIVVDARREWTGIITMEDVVEELIGQIGDEFELERLGQRVSLADILTADRVILGFHAQSMSDVVSQMLDRIPQEALPCDPESVIRAVQQREQEMTVHPGSGLAIPRARLDGLEKPLLAFARSDEGVPLEHTNERAELIFLLLTPRGRARMQPRLLAEIVDLFESEFVTERLRKAQTAEEVIEIIRAGEQVAVG